jgi:hypothetical protein
LPEAPPRLNLALPAQGALPLVDSERRRILIVSDGRVGSTLITAILAAAGADLGLPAVEQWNPLGGAHEHPGLDRLNRALEQAQCVSALAERFPGLATLARLLRSRAKAKVRRLMARGRCLKCSPLAAAYVFKLGPKQTAWIAALTDCTGLAAERLNDVRARIVRPRPPAETETVHFHLDERLDSLTRDLQSLRGRYVPPSPAYLRVLAGTP